MLDQTPTFQTVTVDGGGDDGAAISVVVGGTTKASIDFDGSLTLDDGANLVLDTTTGSKIGTATTQKLGFYNATPVTQRTHVADPSGGATQDAEARTAIAAINLRLEQLGLFAAS